MKKSELRRLVAKYHEINNKLKKTKNKKLHEKLEEIEQRYFHETGRTLLSDTKSHESMNQN